MKTTGAKLLRTLLERQGIKIIPGIPGGAILPFYDALYQSPITHVLARHEQGAGFIAQGMARVTGRAAVCLATSGPGATNLITAIADARMDSVPLVAITGQVPHALIGTDAFQEVDTYGITVPITKHNFLVRSPSELLEIVPMAFRIAESGRPGPVLIDVPKNVQTAEIEIDELPAPGGRDAVARCTDAEIDELAELIRQSRRPVLYLGGGVMQAGAAEKARFFAQRISAPTVATLMALGVMRHDDPLFLGMLGMHGLKGTNMLLEEADLLIAIGARFDDRATGKVSEFCPNAKIAHVDIDKAEIGKIKTPLLSIVADAGDVLARLLERMTALSRPEWCARAMFLKNEYPLKAPSIEEEPLHPVNLCRTIAASLPEDSIITTDVGQHQMWTAQAYPFTAPRTFLTSGGLGTMGFGLPAAIGAALAAPGRRVVCISGDGSILMNIQELATLAELQLPVAIIIFNNARLGLVRQQQQLFYGGRYEASNLGQAPDFAAVARAFGVRGVKIEAQGDVRAQLQEALSKSGPCLIDIPIHEQANVLPMVPPGAANSQTLCEATSS